MTKILTRKIKYCGECPYLDVDWCNNERGDGFINDENGFPDWCPLPDLEEGPVWGDADWGMEEKEDE